MSQSLDDRVQRMLRRLPRTRWFTVLEIILITVLAVQCARLVWAVATPVGPVGEWQSDAGVPTLAAPDMALLETFDPFFRLEGNARVVVTELDLRLFGVRMDEASGRGSAIIALPNGEQDSFSVGDEIMPGVTLEAVDFDFVSISRNGSSEQIFLDQSGTSASSSPQANAPAAVSRTQLPTVSTPARSASTQRIAPSALAAGTQISPRREGNRLTGIILQPSGGNADALRAAGFEPDDVIVSINGERVQDMSQAVTFANNLGTGDRFVQVERNGETISFRARVGE